MLVGNIRNTKSLITLRGSDSDALSRLFWATDENQCYLIFSMEFYVIIPLWFLRKGDIFMGKVKQEVIVYKTGFGGYAQQKFEKDLKKRQKQGWQLKSVVPTRGTLFKPETQTAIWEKEE